MGLVPGGGAMARLSVPRAGRPRSGARDVLLGEDLDGPRAEQYGYVNRLIADEQLDERSIGSPPASRASITRRSRAPSHTSTW